MTPGPDDGTAASLLDLAGGTEGLDPRTLAVLRLIMGQQGATSSSPAALEGEMADLRARLERSEAANRALVAFTECLAGALGACSGCWGADPGCSCGGTGHPGAFPPDRTAFDAFVLPVVRALGARIAARQRLRSAGLGGAPLHHPAAPFHREP